MKQGVLSPHHRHGSRTFIVTASVSVQTNLSVSYYLILLGVFRSVVVCLYVSQCYLESQYDTLLKSMSTLYKCFMFVF